MLNIDEQTSAAIEGVVHEIEGQSSAEVVVVLAARSGRYQDVPLVAALVVGWVTLAILIWSPILLDERFFPIDVALAGGLAAWVGWRWPGLLLSAARKRAQVKEAAMASFYQEAVHGTADRTGLLVYISVLEAQVELIPDAGLQGKIPGAAWNDLNISAESTEALVAGLRKVGVLLAKHVPATDHNPNELPNAPRVRS